ncbi:Nucleolar protein 6 [Durusdinium trenchii]|uniref:Nucleolar protein 6 n=1 Tax=Durusdinium trenchii TaxID=1381693 RepID=A0ABP0LUC3_9DINO
MVRKKRKVGDGKEDAEEKETGGKLPKLDLYRAPDAQEVLEIAHTRNLYKSNLFRLQLEELVKELTPKKAPTACETALHSLKPLLLGKIKAREIQADLAAEFPHLLFQQRSKGEQPMSFRPPKRLDVVGSFLLGTSTRECFTVDVAVEMPSEIFRSKDYLNFRYHDKRAAYVGELHRQLSLLMEGSDALAHLRCEIEAFQGDPSRPALLFRSDLARWSIRLLPTYLPDLWPARMLAVDRNAVRPATGGADGASATPHYNSCVLQDARMREHLETLHGVAERFSFLRDAIRLLKRWALACGFLSSDSATFTPLNGFMLSMLCAHAAITAGVAPAQTTAFQLLKLALSVLSTTQWESQKVIYGISGSAPFSSAESPGAAYFYDGAGVVNFFCYLGPVIDELRYEAQRALSALDQQAPESSRAC